MLNVSSKRDLMSKPFAVKFAHDNPPSVFHWQVLNAA